MGKDIKLGGAIVCWIAAAGVLDVVFTKLGATTLDGFVGTIIATGLILGGLYFVSK